MLPAETSGVLHCFSPSGAALALLTSEGRLRTFDTDSGRLRANISCNKHNDGQPGSAREGPLSDQYTSVCWVELQKNKKKAAAAGPLSCAVVGTSSGDVLSLNLVTCEQKWTTRSCHEGAVTSIAYSRAQSGTVYTAGSDCMVAALDVQTGQVKQKFQGSKHSIGNLTVSPDGQYLLVASRWLTLWETSTLQKLLKFSGHTAPVRAATFTENSSYAVSSASSERQVMVWRTTTSGSKEKPSTSQLSCGMLSLEDPAITVDCCSTSGQDDFQVLAVTENGEAYVWRCSPGGKEAGKPRVQGTLLARIRVGEGLHKGALVGGQEGVLAAKFIPSGADITVLLSYGTTVKPAFQKVVIPAAAAATAAAAVQVISLDPVGGVLLPGGAAATAAATAATAAAKTKASAKKAEATVLGADNMDSPVVMKPVAADDGAGGRKRRGTAAAGDMEAAAEMDTDTDAGDGDVDGEALMTRTLGERLKELTHQQPGGDAADAELALRDDSALKGSVKADSLAVLLTQALRSEDKALLEKVLCTANERIVRNTVRRLAAADAAMLLRQAVDLLRARPRRGMALSGWLRALLMSHAAYLAAAPATQPALTALYQSIEARASLHRQLVGLQGRLDLVLATSGKGKGEEGGEEEEEEWEKPLVVFDDGDDSDGVEVEDPYAAGADDDDDDDMEGDEDDMEADDDDDDEDDEDLDDLEDDI